MNNNEIESSRIKDSALQVNKGSVTFKVKKGNYDESWNAIINNKWESDTFTIFDRFIDKKCSFIDIGSWIGPTVLYGSYLARKVYAIEPDPVAYSELKKNVTLNLPDSENISLFKICIAPESGEINFGNQDEWGNSRSSILFSDRETNQKTTGMDFTSFINTNNIKKCNFIKMDIEGGEYLVLGGMKNYLQKIRPTLYLSLHPKNLGRTPRSNMPEFLISLKRRFLRFRSALNVLNCLNGYRHLYDIKGSKMGNLKFIFTSIRGKSFSIIATDSKW